MKSTKKILIFLGILSLFSLFFIRPVFAQEVWPEELEVKTPKVLPTSSTYFLKDFFRQVRLAFTFSPIKKAEKQLKFVSEKLFEIKEIVQTSPPALVEKSLDNYQKEIEKLKKIVENLKELEKNKFLEKYVNHSFKQQIVLENIASQVKGEVFEKILEARQRHLEKFKEVMEKIEDKEIIKEKIRKAALNVINVSPPRTLKVMESIDEIKEIFPDEIKSKIEEIKEEMIKRAKETFQVFPQKIQAEKIKEQIRTFANPLAAQKAIEEIKGEGVIAPTEEVKTLPIEILQEKLSSLPEEKKVEVLEKIVGQRIEHLEKLQEIKGKLEALPTSLIAPSTIEKVIEKQLEKLEEKIEKIETLPEPAQEKLKEELKEAPKIWEKIQERQKEEGMIKEKKKCLKEGESAPGPVFPPPKDAIYECCEGLIRYIPKGLAGSGGTCIKKEKCAEIVATICVELKSDFCGRSTYGSCKTDDDCLKGGCSSQICHSKSEEPIVSTCEWRDCYNAEAYGVKCGCFENKCQWTKKVSSEKEYFYFGYGSNMNLKGMKNRCPETHFLINKARLSGYELFFIKSGVANIKENENVEVWGVLYKIKEECLKILDRYEGYPTFYQRREVEVEKNSEKIKTLVYIIEKNFSVGKPSQGYLNTILEGAKENNLPQTYIKMIENLAGNQKID